MNTIRSLTAGLAALAAASTCVAANDTTTDDATRISPVVVSATRTAQSAITTPSSITVIDRAEIEASGAHHLVELLRGQGLLQLHDLYGDGSRMTVGLRGFAVTGGSNTLVLVDGRRLNRSDIAPPDLNSMTLEDVQRIEIIQGSAAVLYGDQAVGGVLNIVTRRATGRRAAVSLAGGSYATGDLRASGSERFANGLGLSAALQWRDSDNYRDHNRQQFRYGSLRADYRYAAGRLFAEHQVTAEELELPGALSAAQVDADRRQALNDTDRNDSDNRVSRVGLSHALGESWQLEGEVAYRDSRVDGVLKLFGDVNRLLQEREHFALTPRLVGSLPYGDRDALLIAGLDWDATDYLLDSAGSFSHFVQDADQRLLGVYAQLTLPVTARLTATAGVRHSEVDDKLHEESDFGGFVTARELDVEEKEDAWEAGLSFRWSDAVRLFARYDTPFRFAKVDENAFTSPGVDALEVQTGRSLETGIEWRRDGRQLKLLAYRLDLENEIGFDPSAADPFGTFTGANVNFDDTRRDGLLLEGRFAITERVALAGQVSLVDATFRAGPYRGEAMPMVAEHTARLAVEAQRGAWHGVLEGVYTGERRLDGDFAGTRERLGSHTLLNLTVGYRRGPWNAELKVDNLTDTLYSDYGSFNQFGGDSYYPAPERRLFLTLRYRMGRPG